MTATRRRLVSRFVAAGATRPDRAIAFRPADAATAALFRRLLRHDAIVELPPGRYWLNPGRLDRFRRTVRRRAAAWAATSGLLATLATTATALLLVA